MKTCPKCGKYIPDGGKMCIACGWKPEPAENDSESRLKYLQDAFEAISGKANSEAKTDEYKNSELAALCYLGPAFIYSMRKAGDSKLVRYHANQSLILLAVYLVGSSLLRKLPLVGASAKSLCTLTMLVLAFLGARKAFSGKLEPLPVIGEFGIEIIK